MTTISHTEMCKTEKINGLKGMYFNPNNCHSVILMSDATYPDVETGSTLIYEGHDTSRKNEDPKTLDQTKINTNGTPNQNGLFYRAVVDYKTGSDPRIVKVYKKIDTNLWINKGLYKLVNVCTEVNTRKVFKFHLESI